MSPKVKNFILGVIALLVLLNVVATIFGKKVESVRQEVVQLKTDRDPGKSEEVKQIRAEIAALGERLSKLEDFARSRVASEQESLKKDLDALSAFLQAHEEKPAAPAAQ